MKQVEIIEAFLSKSDREIVQFARQYDVDLTLDEVRRLRPLTQNASITWLVTGIPNRVLRDVEAIIGRRKLRKLLNYME